MNEIANDGVAATQYLLIAAGSFPLGKVAYVLAMLQLCYCRVTNLFRVINDRVLYPYVYNDYAGVI